MTLEVMIKKVLKKRTKLCQRGDSLYTNTADVGAEKNTCKLYIYIYVCIFLNLYFAIAIVFHHISRKFLTDIFCKETPKEASAAVTPFNQRGRVGNNVEENFPENPKLRDKDKIKPHEA